jgi:hypothetical protein
MTDTDALYNALYALIRKAVHDELAVRHVARPVPSTASVGTTWLPQETVRVAGTGGRSYVMHAGDMCKVTGFGRHTAKNPDGAAQPGWQIRAITVREDDPKDVNVEVYHPFDHVARTVKATRLIYVRPTSTA